MTVLNQGYIEDVMACMSSGDLAEDYKWSSDERKREILTFLETLMDAAELADRTATKLIFKGSALSGILPKGDAPPI